jgi:membrane glycosyltransferase
MPEQVLWSKPDPVDRPETLPKFTAFRRSLVMGGTLALTAFAANEMYQVLQVAGLTVLEIVVLILFIVLFAWIAFSLVSTALGFILALGNRDLTLGIDPASPLPNLSSRNALLLPTYNEEPHRIMSRIQAIYESILDSGRLEHFDFFILSDTTDPDIWVHEEAIFLALVNDIGTGKIFYRHRQKNVARKSGNISEWITRFGGRYDHMIVLDADSLMTGDTVVRLAHAMETNPKVGLIQTLPILINGLTVFARVQQFAGRVYGPVIARGIAWWHGSESNYWGHNAIIRVRAFADQAGLPSLRGPKPFGGHILSHDFVEAALMRRAGWAVHMAPDLGGSYEECPPSLTDYALRDRRWCQGNIQHLGVLPARGLHWVSRLHLLTGIGSYITSPMWLIFLLVGILIALQAQFIRPEYFTERSLFPQWPAQDPVRAMFVFAGTMAVLFMPKILGLLALSRRSSERGGCGGMVRAFASLVFESLVSGLLAPIMMLLQSRSIVEVALGRDSGWQPQRRDDGEISFAALSRTYLWPTILGLLLAVSAYVVSWSLFLWMTPVLVGLLLAIPLAKWTADPRLGEFFKRNRVLMTPEERSPPKVLARANELAASSPYQSHMDALARLKEDAILLATHIAMLSQQKQLHKRGDYDVNFLVGAAKIKDSSSVDDAIAMLTAREKFAIVSDEHFLVELMSKPRRAR